MIHVLNLIVSIICLQAVVVSIIRLQAVVASSCCKQLLQAVVASSCLQAVVVSIICLQACKTLGFLYRSTHERIRTADHDYLS